MKAFVRVLMALAPVLFLPGCLYYVFEDQCPAYKPAHELTDKVLVDFNAGKPVGGDPPYPAGWHHSAWVERRLPLCVPDEASMRAFGVHYRADGSEISRFETRYRVAREDGQWKLHRVRLDPPPSSPQPN